MIRFCFKTKESRESPRMHCSYIAVLLVMQTVSVAEDGECAREVSIKDGDIKDNLFNSLQC